MLLIKISYSSIALFKLLFLQFCNSIVTSIEALIKIVMFNEIIIYNNSSTYNYLFIVAKKY